MSWHAHDLRGQRILWVGLIGLCALLLLGYLYLNQESESPGILRISGSETLTPFMAGCAESFMSENPGADIQISGGGSSNGIAALLHGFVDAAMASRELMPAEQKYLAHIRGSILVLPMARDALIIVGHPTLPIHQLSTVQLQHIFSGALTRWESLGGSGQILPAGRAPGSGTATFFNQHILGDKHAMTGETFSKPDEIMAYVATHPGAIGYADYRTAMHWRDQVRILALSVSGQMATPGMSQTPYPLERNLYLLTLGSPSPPLTAFIEYCRGTSGLGLLSTMGFLPPAETRRD